MALSEQRARELADLEPPKSIIRIVRFLDELSLRMPAMQARQREEFGLVGARAANFAGRLIEPRVRIGVLRGPDWLLALLERYQLDSAEVRSFAVWLALWNDKRTEIEVLRDPYDLPSLAFEPERPSRRRSVRMPLAVQAAGEAATQAAESPSLGTQGDDHAAARTAIDKRGERVEPSRRLDSRREESERIQLTDGQSGDVPGETRTALRPRRAAARRGEPDRISRAWREARSPDDPATLEAQAARGTEPSPMLRRLSRTVWGANLGLAGTVAGLASSRAAASTAPIALQQGLAPVTVPSLGLDLYQPAIPRTSWLGMAPSAPQQPAVTTLPQRLPPFDGGGSAALATLPATETGHGIDAGADAQSLPGLPAASAGMDASDRAALRVQQLAEMAPMLGPATLPMAAAAASAAMMPYVGAPVRSEVPAAGLPGSDNALKLAPPELSVAQPPASAEPPASPTAPEMPLPSLSGAPAVAIPGDTLLGLPAPQLARAASSGGLIGFLSSLASLGGAPLMVDAVSRAVSAPPAAASVGFAGATQPSTLTRSAALLPSGDARSPGFGVASGLSLTVPGEPGGLDVQPGRAFTAAGVPLGSSRLPVDAALPPAGQPSGQSASAPGDQPTARGALQQFLGALAVAAPSPLARAASGVGTLGKQLLAGPPDSAGVPGAAPLIASPQMGQITLLAPPVGVASPEAERSGAAVSFDWRTLAEGAGALDAGGLSRLTAVLPAGAQAIYPALPEGSLGAAAVNLTLSPDLASELQQRGYGIGDRSLASRSAALAAGETGTPHAAPLPAKLVPTQRPAGAQAGVLGGAPDDTGALQEAGAGQARRGDALDFLGLPVRLAPSLGGRAELKDEVALRSADPGGAGGVVRPEVFAPLRDRLFPSFQSVAAEPDRRAWAKAAPDFGLRDDQPATLLAPDARVKLPTASSPLPQMGGGSSPADTALGLPLSLARPLIAPLATDGGAFGSLGAPLPAAPPALRAATEFAANRGLSVPSPAGGPSFGDGMPVPAGLTASMPGFAPPTTQSAAPQSTPGQPAFGGFGTVSAPGVGSSPMPPAFSGPVSAPRVPGVPSFASMAAAADGAYTTGSPSAYRPLATSQSQPGTPAAANYTPLARGLAALSALSSPAAPTGLSARPSGPQPSLASSPSSWGGAAAGGPVISGPSPSFALPTFWPGALSASQTPSPVSAPVMQLSLPSLAAPRPSIASLMATAVPPSGVGQMSSTVSAPPRAPDMLFSGLRPDARSGAPAVTIQRSPVGATSAAARREKQGAEAPKAVKAPAKDMGPAAGEVNLLANEVWALLKRRIATEAERAGRW